MRRKNLRILAAVSAGTDALLIFLSYFIALDLRFRVLDGYVSISMNSAPFRWMMAAYALVVVTICAGLHLYQPFRNRRFLRTAGLFMAVNAMATGVLMSVLFTLKIIDFSRMTLMLFWVVSTVLVCAKTLATRRLLYRLRRQGRMLRHVIVIGNGKNARTYMEEARRQPELGLKVEGYISGMPKKGLGKNLGRYEDLGRILEKGGCDSLVVALEPHEISFMPAVLEAAEKEGVRVEMIPLYNRYHAKGFEIYAVSLDVDKTVWASAVRNQKLPWINVCDGLGGGSVATRLYNVPSLPTSYIIADGSLVADVSISDEASLRKYLDAVLK